MSANIPELRLRALTGLPEIAVGADLGALLADGLRALGVTGSTQPTGPTGRGVLCVAQKIVSKAEGRTVRLADVAPSARATELAAKVEKDPRQVELVLRESVRVVRAVPGVLITQTRHGFVCANAGVDLSNAGGVAGEIAVLLPEDPDTSAARIRAALGPALGVIVTDTFGRPWREGLVDVAIGVAGLAPLDDQRGETDRAGHELQVTVMARADQLAAAAGILMRKDAGVPAVWIEGLGSEGVTGGDEGSIAAMIRDPERDLFR